jgi:hypothetical protein
VNSKSIQTTFLVSLLFPTSLWANQVLLDDFSENSTNRWDYFSDQVMGGVSVGNFQIITKENESYAQLIGEVSTKNNGGFIQFRADVSDLSKENLKGIYLRAKGNNQKYFVHLRTKGTLLPWQYYQAEFLALDEWQLIKLPLESFVASSGWLRKNIVSTSMKTLGIVAFGRDHIAELSISEVGFY